MEQSGCRIAATNADREPKAMRNTNRVRRDRNLQPVSPLSCSQWVRPVLNQFQSWFFAGSFDLCGCGGRVCGFGLPMTNRRPRHERTHLQAAVKENATSLLAAGFFNVIGLIISASGYGLKSDALSPALDSGQSLSVSP